MVGVGMRTRRRRIFDVHQMLGFNDPPALAGIPGTANCAVTAASTRSASMSVDRGVPCGESFPSASKHCTKPLAVSARFVRLLQGALIADAMAATMDLRLFSAAAATT